MKILFVTKDMGGANVAIPVAEELRNRGHEVLAAAEGLSMEKWEKAGYHLALRGQTNPDNNDQMNDPASVCYFLRQEKPHVVIATLGWPINAEQTFSVCANQMDIPLVWIEDV